jgi:hypothetical protein
MKFSVLLLAITLLFGTAHCEVLMETSFDLNPEQDTASASAAITSFLENSNLKWIRYFHILITGRPGTVPMRTAHFMFKDMAAWGAFEQENLEKTHSLHDNNWINSRRTLWVVQPSLVDFSEKTRTEAARGGFMYVLQYSVAPGKETQFATRYQRGLQSFALELKKNEGFVESRQYSAEHFQSSFTHMTTYEFVDMPSLVEAMHGDYYTSLIESVKQHLGDYAVTILSPGPDDGAALFWTAAGADKEEL